MPEFGLEEGVAPGKGGEVERREYEWRGLEEARESWEGSKLKSGWGEVIWDSEVVWDSEGSN